MATFIKATTDTLTQFGVGGRFTHWPAYALAVGSVAALFRSGRRCESTTLCGRRRGAVAGQLRRIRALMVR